MRSELTMEHLAQKLRSQKKASQDYLADTRQLEYDVIRDEEEEVDNDYLYLDGGGSFWLDKHARRQLGQRLGIPAKFFDRLFSDHEDLLTKNVNTLLHREPKRRLVRTMGSRCRAFLSDRYRRLDNFELAEAVLPLLQEHGNVEIRSCALTETRMYIKATFPDVQDEIETGDVVESGIAISNSEVGDGSLQVEPLVYRLVCQNGMVSKEHGLRQIHAGSGFDVALDRDVEILSDETKKKEDSAIWSKVRDITRAVLDEDIFEEIVQKMKNATDRPIEDATGTVDELADRFDLTEDERDGVLSHLAEGGDLNQYGAANAVTRTAQDVDRYERSHELQEVGAEVLDLTDDEWEQMAA